VTAAWIAVAAVGIGTIAIKAAGPLVFAERPLPRVVTSLMPLLAPCLLAALVISQTLADGRSLAIDARAAGVAAGGAALLARAPLLVVLVVAAGAAAAARALGAA
jgi:branched-subunit amino acid transport protein